MLDLDSDIYAGNNQTQQKGAAYVLENHLKLIKWRKNPSILDVGTGDGTVLVDLLIPRLPTDFQKVVAVDVNQEMLNIAAKKFERIPKVEISRMDIATPVLELEFVQHFDHIFSFFCLHWVVEQRRAFRNLFEMLKPGGDMLVTLIAKDVAWGVYEKMLKMNKWAPFMSDIKEYTYPYYHSLSPSFEIERHSEFSGFVDCSVKLEARTQIFRNLEEFWKFSCGINPFIKRIPSRLSDQYKTDYLNEVRRGKTVLFQRSGEISMPYEILVVYAAKPKTTKPD